MHRHRVIVIDDHAMLRDGIRQLVFGEFNVVGEAGSASAGLELCQHIPCDVVVLDSYLPEEDIDRALAKFHATLKPSPPFVLLVGGPQDDFLVLRALRHGLRVFIEKRDDGGVLLAALRAAVRHESYVSPVIASRLTHLIAEGAHQRRRGTSPLTQREQQVLHWIANGKTNKEIASLLGVSVHTVDAHRRSLRTKLRARNLAELIAAAYRDGLALLGVKR